MKSLSQCDTNFTLKFAEAVSECFRNKKIDGFSREFFDTIFSKKNERCARVQQIVRE